MDNFHYISSEVLNFEDLHEIISYHKSLALSEEAKINIQKCREYLDKKIDLQDSRIFGNNSGFETLYNEKKSNENISQFQENVLKSHASGTGDEVPLSIVKLMLLLKIQALSYGYSGVQLETVDRLVEFYNNDILPVVYTQGSQGCSDDLAPLAHLSLPLIGKGEVYFEGKKVPTIEVLKQFNWKPIVLQSKEGLALLNGTQLMSAYGTFILLKSVKYCYLADLIAAISLEGFNGSIEPFNELIHYIRPHKGQIMTANRVLEFLEGSEIAKKSKLQVQDPYSFHCIPQVHGATKDAIDYVRKVFKTEINSVTDNPNIFIESDQILSGGNFHGQPLALALDYIGIALAALGSISERRIFQLNSVLRNLPEFFINTSSLNSELSIQQLANLAVTIDAQNKPLAIPASICNIVYTTGHEDHVSMGAKAATKALLIIDNLERILAIELMIATQAIEIRRPLQSSDFIEMFLKSYREEVSLLEIDKDFHNVVKKSVAFLNSFMIDELEY